MAIPIWDSLNVQHSRNIRDKVASATTDGTAITSAQRDYHLNSACRIWMRKKVLVRDWNALRNLIGTPLTGTLSSATIDLSTVLQANSILTDSAYTVAANGLDITNFGSSVTINYVGGTFIGIDNGTPITRVVAAYVGTGAFTLGGTALTAGAIVTTAYVIPPAVGGILAVKSLTAVNTSTYEVTPLPLELSAQLTMTNSNQFLAPSATEPKYLIRGSILTVYPVATYASSTYTLEYIKRHSALTANTGSTDLPIATTYHDEILKLALIESEREKADPSSVQRIQLLEDQTIDQEAMLY